MLFQLVVNRPENTRKQCKFLSTINHFCQASQNHTLCLVQYSSSLLCNAITCCYQQVSSCSSACFSYQTPLGCGKAALMMHTRVLPLQKRNVTRFKDKPLSDRKYQINNNYYLQVQLASSYICNLLYFKILF